MLRWSNNHAAGETIHALSWPYINGALASAGFFDASQQQGVWLSASYDKRYGYWTGGANIKLHPTWQTRQKQTSSSQAATARSAARMFTLIGLDKLVSSAASSTMRTLMDRKANWGIGSYCEYALETAHKTVDQVSSKIGYMGANPKEHLKDQGHDAAIVTRTVGSGQIKYVAIGLGAIPRDPQIDDPFNALDDCIVCAHP